MLSAAPASEGPSPTQILVELLKTELGYSEDGSVLLSQLDALKIASALEVDFKSTAASHKLTESFLKIDEVLFKFSESLIKGESTDDKHKTAFQALSDEFLKLDGIVQDFGSGEENALVPAVQEVREAANKLFDNLSLLGNAGDTDHKTQELFIKLTEDFLKIEQGLIKLDEDIVFKMSQGTQGDIKYLEIRFDQVLISSALIDAETQDQLKAFETAANNILIGLLQPTLESPTGAVVLGDSGGDVIST